MRRVVRLLVAIMLLFSFYTSANNVFATSLSDSIILQLTETHTENQIDIDVKLVTNTGISAMTLELVYNKDVFEYNGYEKSSGTGAALENLDLISTDLSNNETLPVKFNWLNQNVENDFSTGNILKLHFKLKSNTRSGNYKIGFKYESGDIVYIENNNPNSKSAIISKAVVSVAENKITKTEIVETEAKDVNALLIVGIVLAGSAAVAATIFVSIKKIKKQKRKNKNWVKI